MRRWMMFAAFVASATAARAQELPTDLQFVPANAIGFVHVRTHELWNSPLMSTYRDALIKAGPDAIKLMQERISPDPSTIERATVL